MDAYLIERQLQKCKPEKNSSLFALLASGKFPSGYLWVVVMAGISYAWTLLGSQIERSRESSIDPCGGLNLDE